MNLNQIIKELLLNKIVLSKRYLKLVIEPHPQIISVKLLKILNILLHQYDHIYFIIIKNIPPCLIPGALNNTIYKKQKGSAYVRLDNCDCCHIKLQCPGWCTELALSTRYSKAITDQPSEIAIEITGQCNLNCYNCTTTRRNTKNVSLKTAQKILQDARRWHVPDIRFTGGEPLFNPELPEMLTYAKSSGFYVMLNTNATLITSSWLNILSESVDNVLVSLQGFNDKSDKTITGSPVPFIKKIQNILRLRACVPTLRIGTVINPMLLDYWPQYEALIKAIRPYTWALFRPINQYHNPKYNLNKKDYYRLAKRVLILNREGISTKIANALPFCYQPDISLTASTMLGALSDDGNTRLVWDVRGFFKPSYFIDKNLGITITNAWKHPFLKKLKNTAYLPEECQTCTFWKWCRGGSRALAGKTYNTYFTADPWFDKKNARKISL